MEIKLFLILLMLVYFTNCGDDFYKILEVDHNTSTKDMKKAFRRLSKRYHPDLNPGNKDAQQMFIKLNRAYETLSDPEKKKIYDLYGEEGLSKEDQ